MRWLKYFQLVVVLVTHAIVTWAQDTKLMISGDNKKFVVGQTATLQLESNLDFEKVCDNPNLKLSIDNFEITYAKVDKAKREWNITLPDKYEIIGLSKTILFTVDNVIVGKLLLDGIYSLPPEFQAPETSEMFTDVSTEQTLVFFVKGAKYLKYIGLDGNDIVFAKANLNPIPREFFNADEKTNKITLALRVKPSATTIKLKLYYFGEELSEIAKPIEILIDFNRKYPLFSPFSISSFGEKSGHLYVDDFDPDAAPQYLKFDLTGLPKVAHTIDIDGTGVVLTHNNNNKIDLSTADDRANVKVRVAGITRPGVFLVKLIPVSGSTKYIGEFEVFQRPSPKSFRIRGTADYEPLKIRRIPGAKYSISIEGNDRNSLDKIPNLQVKIIDQHGTVTTLPLSSRSLPNEIIAELDFSQPSMMNLALGQYEVEVVRQKDNKGFKVSNTQFEIAYPKQIDFSQIKNFTLTGPTRPTLKEKSKFYDLKDLFF